MLMLENVWCNSVLQPDLSKNVVEKKFMGAINLSKHDPETILIDLCGLM